MKPIAMVDVDNVLWDFASLLYQSLKLKNPETPHWIFWDSWGFPEKFVPKKEFHSIIDDIHETQEAGQPFAYASRVLDLLSKWYDIVIATHRRKDYKPHLENWLKMNGLKYDRIYCGQDKTELFDPCVGLVIDDSPIVLEKAMKYCLDPRSETGKYYYSPKVVVGIVYPWNIELKKRTTCSITWTESLKDLYINLKGE